VKILLQNLLGSQDYNINFDESDNENGYDVSSLDCSSKDDVSETTVDNTDADPTFDPAVPGTSSGFIRKKYSSRFNVKKDLSLGPIMMILLKRRLKILQNKLGLAL
jgi:hypothetical protein